MFTHLLPTKGLSVATALTLAAALAGTSAQAQTIDGTRDASYAAPLAVQANPTQFGDSASGQTGGANGDELDNISARIVGSDLYLFIGGNLQSNNNHLEIFFDSKTGGQNQLAAGGGGPLANLTGLKFDAGFTADYLISVSVQGTSTYTPTSTPPVLPTFTSITVDYGVVGGTGSLTAAGMGTTAAASATVTYATGITGAVAINNSNTAGVGAYTAAATPVLVNGVATNGTGPVTGASAVATGLEMRIPLAALGTTYNGGDFKIAAFTNGASHDYVSNQALGPFPYGTGNLGNGAGGYTSPSSGNAVGMVDFTAYAGNQYVTVTNTGLLATAAARTSAQVSVVPNPAQERFTVLLPATTSAEPLGLTLYNSLGQPVRQLSQPASTTATSVAVDASGLATGVYLLRVQAGAEVLATQRVALN